MNSYSVQVLEIRNPQSGKQLKRCVYRVEAEDRIDARAEAMGLFGNFASVTACDEIEGRGFAPRPHDFVPIEVRVESFGRPRAFH